tara:strand:+ start:37 stop:606 length:570 start_codon:yes stop_codon:yes gene_type:complete
MFGVEYIFPTPIWHMEYDASHMIPHVFDLREQDQGRKVSNVGGWQSNDIPPDTEWTQEFIKAVVKKIPYFMDEFGDSTKKLEFDNMWFNINPSGAVNLDHIHGGSFLSGVLWLVAPEGSGNIVFSRSTHESYILYSNVQNPNRRCGFTDWQYEPKENLAVIFPSWLSHRVEINNTDSDRVSLAFNLSWK